MSRSGDSMIPQHLRNKIMMSSQMRDNKHSLISDGLSDSGMSRSFFRSGICV